MAVGAQWYFAAWRCRHHLVHGRRVAIEARILSDAAIPGFNLDWFVKVFECERQRVTKSIVRLGQQMSDDVMWQMTVVADGNIVVTRMLPRIVVRLHDVTVRARRGVAHQIAVTLAVPKCKQPDAG